MRIVKLFCSFLICYFLCGCSGNTSTQDSANPLDSHSMYADDVGTDTLIQNFITEEDIKTNTYQVTNYGIVVQETTSITSFMQNLQNLKLEYQIETSVTIMMEGPHCDLIDWEHGYSDWIDFTSQVDSLSWHFEWPEMPDSVNRLFPEVEINDLKKRVREHCGEVWYKHIVDIKSPFEYPAGVSPSRILFRVSGNRTDNGMKTSRIFSVQLDMGC